MNGRGCPFFQKHPVFSCHTNPFWLKGGRGRSVPPNKLRSQLGRNPPVARQRVLRRRAALGGKRRNYVLIQREVRGCRGCRTTCRAVLIEGHNPGNALHPKLEPPGCRRK